MNPDVGVIAGLIGIIAFMSYFSVYFLNQWNDSHEGKRDGEENLLDWSRKIGILFFMLSIIFVNMLMHTILLIAQNSAVSYLSDPVLVIGLTVVMWATLAGIGIYTLTLTGYGLLYMYEVWDRYKKGSRLKGDLF